MKRLLPALVLGCALIPSRPAAAEEKAARSEAPNLSETIDCVRARTGFTVAAGHLEGDAIYYHTRLSDVGRSGFDMSGDSLSAALAYGVTDWFTAKAVLPLLLRRDFDPGGVETGIGDIGLEAKLSLKKDLSPLGFVPLVDVSAGLAITLPTGDEDKGLGIGDPTFSPYASASYWFEKWFGLHGSVFFQFQSGERTIHGGSAAAEFIPWMRELSLLAALEFRQQGWDSPSHTFIPGAEYRFTSQVSVGLGLPIGITHRAEDWGLILNAQLDF